MKTFTMNCKSPLYFLLFCMLTSNIVRSDCPVQITCVDCMRSSGCTWCLKPFYVDSSNSSFPRCNTQDVHQQNGCVRQLFHHESVLDITEYDKIAKSVGRLKATSISPQRMSLKLAVGKPVKFSVEIGEMEDYPLDMYFLMDLTNSMKDDKAVLANGAQDLTKEMREVTSKFRIGFGSFIDKVALPFTQTSPQLIESWRKGKCPECIAPYGYKHHFSLSEDSKKFEEEVNKANISASSDLPEGGFDALMQAIVCEKEIGWSNQGRRVIVFATDDAFHIAGDGRLAGILRPNDGSCHLDSVGMYTHSTMLDYPSIAQLNSKVLEKSVTLIFAVTEPQFPIYEQLKEKLFGSHLAEITGNSSNIVQIVKEEYKRISGTVEITDNFTSYLTVKYSTGCTNNITYGDKKSCPGIKVGDIVPFDVEIKLEKCPEDKNQWKKMFKISRLNVPDALLLDLEMLCGCPCEDDKEQISSVCNGKGGLKCGVCQCDPHHYGEYCQCSSESISGARFEGDNGCRETNTTPACSGRGKCECGQCACESRTNIKEVYSGKYCECDNFSCERFKDELCAGHGTCKCGKCECNPEWTGLACDCSTQNNTCKEMGVDEPCSGESQGECKCGKCNCKGSFSGEFCELCRGDSCQTKCEDLKNCVQCKLFGTGKLENAANCELTCFRHLGLKKEDLVDVIPTLVDPNTKDVACKGKDETDQCSYFFNYNYDRRKDVFSIVAQREKECPPKPPIFWIVVGVVSLVVIIGLLSVGIWQLLQYLQTQREYSTFKNATKDPNWASGQNVLYREPKTTFHNPIYGGLEDQHGFATTSNPSPAEDDATSRRRLYRNAGLNVVDKSN